MENQYISNDQWLCLLKESILAVGKYIVEPEFYNGQSVAIILDETPVVLLGWPSEPLSHEVADRLLASEEFKTLVFQENPQGKILRKAIVKNKDFCSLSQKYDCLTESQQGFEENGLGQGMLVAVFPNNDSISFALGACINNSIMKCFYPDAQDLSIDLNFCHLAAF